MRFTALFVMAPLCFAGGVHPRPSSGDYAAHETAGDVTIGAEVLTAKQVHNFFASDLKKYIVVEIAIYPKDGTSLDINRVDFSLKLPNGDIARAANPSTIVRPPQQSAPAPGRRLPVDVYQTAGVGYESGTDPNGVRRKGVYTETGVAVTNGGPVGGPPVAYPPSSQGPDPQTTQMELEDRALPEGAASQPVAGFLYFPASAKKNATYELEYYVPQGARVHLTLK